MSFYTPRQITKVLILGALVLTLASAIIHVITFDPKNSETYRLGWSFPLRNEYMAWFSMSISSPVPRTYAAVLFMVAGLLIGRSAQESIRFHYKMFLWSASGFCLFYAVEKIMTFHLSWPVFSYPQVLLSTWILWYIPIIPVMYGLFRILPVRIRFWLISSCFLLVGSFMIDRWSEHFTGRHSGHHMLGALMGDAEGMMEMMGAVLLIHGMLVYRMGNADR